LKTNTTEDHITFLQFSQKQYLFALKTRNSEEPHMTMAVFSPYVTRDVPRQARGGNRAIALPEIFKNIFSC